MSEDRRETFFNKISTELTSVGKKGFSAMNFFVALKKQSLKTFSFPANAAATIKSSLLTVDPVSRQLYPGDAPQHLQPIQVIGDGNCFYRSISTLVFGHDAFHKEMRARVVFEMVSNWKLYAHTDTYLKMSQKPTSVEELLLSSLQNDCIIPGDHVKSLQKDIIKSTNDGQYASLLQIFATANVLKRPIVSIFPTAQNSAVNRELYNQRVVPLENDKPQEEIHVMWTHTRNTDLNGWVPNHFVACISNLQTGRSSMSETHEPPLKKAKHDCDESCEEEEEKKEEEEYDDDDDDEKETSRCSDTPITDKTSKTPFASIQEDRSNQGNRWQTPEIGDSPNQPKSHTFPRSLFGKKRRGFNVSWYDSWKWLHYVESSDTAFCHVCITAYRKGNLTCHKKERAFISKGFRNWKKATERFNNHEKSECHQEALEREFKLKDEVQDVGEALSEQHKASKARNRQCMMKVIRAIQYLARQGIALRGDGKEVESNFNQLLKLQSKHDPELKEWLKQKTNKYTAPDIQNELLQVMANMVLRPLLSDIKSAQFVSIMADETADASNTEQLVVCLRWVDDNFVAHEDFLGLHSLSDIGSDTITKTLKDIFVRFDIPMSKVRGQCYDMAAAMAGEKKGVATQVKNLEPRALYTHCYGHALNLACNDAIKRCKLLGDTLDVAREITKLIKDSPRREAILKRLKGSKEFDKGTPGIRVLCPTRWTVKADTLKSIVDNYEVLAEVWEESLQYVRDVEVRGRIRGVATYMEKFDFYFGCVLCEKVLRYSDNLARGLQAPTLSASQGQSMASATVRVLEILRDEKEFETFYQDVEESTKALNVGEPALPRQRRPPKRLDTGAPPHTYKSCEDRFRAIYFEAIDLIVNGIKSRFDQPGYRMYMNLENLLTKTCKAEPCEAEFQHVTDFYGTDFKAADLRYQLKLLQSMLPKDFDPKLTEIVQFLEDKVALFSEVAKLLKLILVLPATNATSERSFSVLKRVKTALRATMSQKRLNSMMLLHVHKGKTDALSISEVGREFVGVSEHRLSIFGHFQ